MFKIKIISRVINIFLFNINKTVNILGINPNRGGIPAILINKIRFTVLFILLLFKIVIVWNKKFVLVEFIVFVAEKVINE